MAEDRKMNEFMTASDATYVYVELADGSQGKIRKSDLRNLIYLADIHGNYDLNELPAGEAYITVPAINSPSDWVYVKTMKAGSSPDKVQIAISVPGIKMWIRIRNNLTWSTWKEISFTT